MGFRMAGSGCCCTTCNIIDEAESSRTEVSTGSWDQVSGTWSVASGLLTVSDANASLISDNGVESGDGMWLGVNDCVGDDTGDKLRFFVGYDDTDNHLYAEIEIGGTNSTLRLYRRISGTTTQLGSNQTLTGLSAGEEFSIVVCANEGYLTATARTATQVASIKQTQAAPGLKAGIGTGALTADAFFGSLTFATHRKEERLECPACGLPCANCVDSESPALMKLVLQGMDTGPHGCNLNGTYLVDTNCGVNNWALTAPTCPLLFGNSTVTLTVAFQAGSVFPFKDMCLFVQGSFTCLTGSFSVTWESQDFETLVPCMTLVDERCDFEVLLDSSCSNEPFAEADIDDSWWEVTAL